MFDRLTDRARKIMGLARAEALRQRHDEIRPEHLLLALAEEGSGVGASALKNRDVDLGRLRAELKRRAEPGVGEARPGQIPFTAAARRVLETSLEEANGMGHTYIGSEHLLLGLARDRKSQAGEVLRAAGANADAIRREVLEILGAEPPGPDAAFKARHQYRVERPPGVSSRDQLRILLSILQLGEGGVAEVLREAGVDREALIEAIRRRISEA
jgi:ATP-dependent Clp protease ATP-binding subunit ClpC